MAQQLPRNGTVLGLDIGDARIGLAVASVIARIPRPIETISNNADTANKLKQVIAREDAGVLIVGIPRNLSGEETAQSQKIRDIAEVYANELGLEMVFVDESFSSKKADEYLAANPKHKIPQDSLAACFILDEFFATLEVR